MIVVEMKDISVVLNNNFKLKWVIVFFFLLLSDLIVFEIILIELKLVNDIKNIDVIFFVCLDKLLSLLSVCIVINLLDNSFVVIIELVWIVFCYGILIKNVNGVKIKLINVWKF